MEELRDYAMGEGDRTAREAMAKHVAACGECAAEMKSLELTTAALRMLPEREVPQRIAFVSDRVFEQSAASKWFGGFWNSAARLGFASASVLAIALVIAAYRPGASSPQQQVMIPASVSKGDVDRAVNEAVAKAVAQVREQDAAVLAAAEQKHEQEHKALMVTMGQNLDYLERKMNSGMILASNDQERFGGAR
ncbi:MAG TPA: hypothetical protein VEF06_11370 [Bryobacteraceae bacterium]|nr:hypothetical protein [Bryobacteraceae bacterium]